MTKRQPSAHATLDQLRQAAVDRASDEITEAYAAENQRAVTTARKAEQDAVAQVRELQHRIDGAAIRVGRAQAQADIFEAEHARELTRLASSEKYGAGGPYGDHRSSGVSPDRVVEGRRLRPGRGAVVLSRSRQGHGRVRTVTAALAERVAPVELGSCKRCGAPFVRNARGRPRRFCGGCAPRRAVVHMPRPCVECGGEFTPSRSDRIVCSTSCRWKRKRRLKREREAVAA